MNMNEWLIKYLEDIKDVGLKTQEDISEIKITLAAHKESLDYHIRRTDLLEEQIELMRGELEPVQDHVKGIKFLAKVIGVVSLLVGILVGLFEILK